MHAKWEVEPELCRDVCANTANCKTHQALGSQLKCAISFPSKTDPQEEWKNTDMLQIDIGHITCIMLACKRLILENVIKFQKVYEKQDNSKFDCGYNVTSSYFNLETYNMCQTQGPGPQCGPHWSYPAPKTIC